MDATTYMVTLKLATEGNLSAGLSGVDSKAGGAAKALGDVSANAKSAGDTLLSFTGRAGEALAGVADRALDVGLSMAKLGAAAIAGVATYGVAHLNNELEQTQISLAAIGQAQGFTSTFAGGMTLAADQLAKMKQDVKTLPGDLGQLSDLMKTIATPAAQAGASMDTIRGIAGRTMLTSAILGVPQEVAAREMAQLLSGRAGAHNILGTRLGLVGEEAKTFNKESPEDRLKKINSEMDKYQGAADRFGQSFVANWTTLKDNIKYVLLAPATAPLFESVKHTMAEINTYFDTHKDKIDSIVHVVGGKLADSWTLIVDKAKELEPLIARIGPMLVNFDPARFASTVSHVGGGLLAAKVGGTALSLGSRAVGSLMKSDLLGAMGGGAEGALGSLGLVALPALAVAALAAAGAVDNLVDKQSRYHDSSVELTKQIGEDLDGIKNGAEPAMSSLRQFGDYLGEGFLTDVDLALKSITGLGYAVGKMFGDSHPFDDSDDALNRARFNASRDVGGPIKEHAIADLMDHHGEAFAAGLVAAKSADVKSKVPPIHVTNNVTINVQSNADPSRVARLVHQKFQDKVMYPTRSKFTPIYDGSGDGA